MLPGHRDVPLDEDEASRFLPWIVALMVYFATLALAIAMALSSVVERWHNTAAETLTVQVPAAGATRAADGDGAHAAERTPEDAARLAAALDILRRTPGVAAAEPLDRSEVEALLEPWLGSGIAAEDLPLPQVVDVMLEPGGRVDLATLEAELAEAVPGASVDSHAKWFRRLASLARSVEGVAILVVLLTGAGAAIAVVLVTRSSLAVHRHIIEVLHLVGAQDSYIARQFQYHALKMGLRGAIPGVLLAVATLFLVGLVAGRIDLPLLPEMRLSRLQWAVVAALPLAAGLIAMITARITVLRTLARML